MIAWGLFGVALLAFAGCNVLVFLRVLRPLRRLVAQAESITKGNLDALEQPCGGTRELESLRRAMAGMVGHLRRVQEQTHTYADVLTHAQESERARIARELHDDTIQSLVAVAQNIEMAQLWNCDAPEQTADMLRVARLQVIETIRGLRNLIGDLRPPALDELGLIAALKMQAEKIDGLVVQITVQGDERRLDAAQELALFRCAQEALANARGHGHATAAQVRVVYHCHGVGLTITDNGAGFDPPGTLDDLAEGGHYGLIGIQERVQSLGGTMQIARAETGMRLDLSLPQDCAPQPEDTVRDPVCSAFIQPQQAYGSTEYNGERYYFCCPVCQGAFQNDPQMYLNG